jgi:stage II sporulation protein M
MTNGALNKLYVSFKTWVLVAVALFGIGIVLGLTVPMGADLMADDLAVLRELSTIFGPFKITTAIFIFFKNVSALLISFLFSPILVLTPILALVVNGWLIALVSTTVVEQESLGLLLAGLLPHGVFELPALIIGEAAALSFGVMVVMSLFSAEKRKELVPNLKRNVRYLLRAFALLLPAAIIETYVTPIFLS